MLKRKMLIKSVIGFLLLLGVGWHSGCGNPGDSETNSTHSVVTILAINDDQTLLSDVVEDGATGDDSVMVQFQSQSRGIGGSSTDVGDTSPFDTIVFKNYHVSHHRSDGGPTPADFTAGINIALPSDTADKTIYVTVVRAFDKNRTPLEELWENGQIFVTTTITFHGEDGYGNGITVSGSIPISYANFPDEDS